MITENCNGKLERFMDYACAPASTSGLQTFMFRCTLRDQNNNRLKEKNRSLSPRLNVQKTEVTWRRTVPTVPTALRIRQGAWWRSLYGPQSPLWSGTAAGQQRNTSPNPPGRGQRPQRQINGALPGHVLQTPAGELGSEGGGRAAGSRAEEQPHGRFAAGEAAAESGGSS